MSGTVYIFLTLVRAGWWGVKPIPRTAATVKTLMKFFLLQLHYNEIFCEKNLRVVNQLDLLFLNVKISQKFYFNHEK
jgi:hypothetical protein